MRDVITGLDYFRFDRRSSHSLSLSKFPLNRGLIFAAGKKTNGGGSEEKRKRERKRERIEVRAYCYLVNFELRSEESEKLRSLNAPRMPSVARIV